MPAPIHETKVVRVIAAAETLRMCDTQIAGVEDCHDDDGADVVNDGRCGQKNAEFAQERARPSTR